MELLPMNTSSKWLVKVSLLNLVSNAIGIVIALQHNLISDLGGSLHGQNVFHDFLTTTGTALSAPLPFMLIQIVLTLLALQTNKSRTIGIIGLSFVGFFYTLAQAGERILFRLLSPGGFDLVQAIVFLVNVASAIAMLVFGIRAWTSRQTPEAIAVT